MRPNPWPGAEDMTTWAALSEGVIPSLYFRSLYEMVKDYAERGYYGAALEALAWVIEGKLYTPADKRIAARLIALGVKQYPSSGA